MHYATIAAAGMPADLRMVRPGCATLCQERQPRYKIVHTLLWSYRRNRTAKSDARWLALYIWAIIKIGRKCVSIGLKHRNAIRALAYGDRARKRVRFNNTARP